MLKIYYLKKRQFLITNLSPHVIIVYAFPLKKIIYLLYNRILFLNLLELSVKGSTFKNCKATRKVQNLIVIILRQAAENVPNGSLRRSSSLIIIRFLIIIVANVIIINNNKKFSFFLNLHYSRESYLTTKYA